MTAGAVKASALWLIASSAMAIDSCATAVRILR
jgi:hypothetical protein